MALCVCVFFSKGFSSQVRVTEVELSLFGGVGLLANIVMAFALNIVGFHINRSVGPLGMSVAGMCC